ncbi:MAG: hypothetical protein Kow00109_29470 [Acidobacteriota bacterium]
MFELQRKVQRKQIRREHGESHSYLRVLDEEEVLPFGNLRFAWDTTLRSGGGMVRRLPSFLDFFVMPLQGAVDIRLDTAERTCKIEPGRVARIRLRDPGSVRLWAPEAPSRFLEIGLGVPAEGHTAPAEPIEWRDFRDESGRWPKFTAVLAPDGAEDSLAAGYDAHLFRWFLSAGEQVRYETVPPHRLFLILLRGALQAGKFRLLEGDSLRGVGEPELDLVVNRSSDLVLIETS